VIVDRALEQEARTLANAAISRAAMPGSKPLSRNGHLARAERLGPAIGVI
jgi:hypothetical protein